jgi:ankyrin repeat protein
LHEGAYNGHKEIVELLINSGADVNAVKTDGMTPLDMATMNSHNEIVDLLRKHDGKTREELNLAEGK